MTNPHKRPASMPVERYRLTATHNMYGEHYILEDSDTTGKWVKYADISALSIEAETVKPVAWGLLQMGDIIEVTTDHMRKEAWVRGGCRFVSLFASPPQPIESGVVEALRKARPYVEMIVTDKFYDTGTDQADLVAIDAALAALSGEKQ